MSQRQPWFKFWASDFLTDPDIDRLSLDAQAIVIRLWCLCTLHGGFPDDQEEVARLTRCKLQYIQQCWQQCTQHFRLEGKRWISPRMEREKVKSDTARRKAETRWNKSTSVNGDAGSNASSNAGSNADSNAQKARKPESQIEEPFGLSSEVALPLVSARPFIEFPTNLPGELFPVFESQITQWRGLYPAVDVLQELRNMYGWLESRPRERKTKSGLPRFVQTWLKRAQDAPARKANGFNAAAPPLKFAKPEVMAH